MTESLRRWRYRLAVPLLRLFQRLAARLSRSALLSLGRACGTMIYLFAVRDRLRAQTHLALAFPDLPRSTVKLYARRSFENLAVGLLEILARNARSPEAAAEEALVENPEVAGQLVAQTASQPAIFVTAHIGNWELSAALFARCGGRLGVIARRRGEGDFDDFLASLREGAGFRVFASDAPPRQLLRAIRDEGLSIGVLPDQDITGVDGYFIDFFGRPAYTPSAPAKLALLTRTPLYLAALVRVGDRFRYILEGPIRPVEGPGGRATEAERLTRAWSAAVERLIRQYPDQWVWMHRRWRNTPERIRRRRASEGAEAERGA